MKKMYAPLTLALFAACLLVALPAAAQQCTNCSTVIAWGTWTQNVTGSSNNDCMWASMDANNQIDSICNPHGFCYKDVTVITPCTAQSAPYTIVKQVEYACQDCLDEIDMATGAQVELMRRALVGDDADTGSCDLPDPLQ